MMRLVLDTDVGIDDALMLVHLAAEPAVEIVAIGSTHGNCSSAQGAINALRVLEAIGREDIPVAIGNESPVPGAVHSWHVHGHDGIGDANLPAPVHQPTTEGSVDQIIRLGKEQPGELILVAVGTMTNLAAALARDPESLARYREVWILGGISHRPTDSEREMFDANIYNSPEAADVLFSSGTRLTICPIDLSYQAVLTDQHIERIFSSDTPAARLSAQILPCYFNFYQQHLGRWTCCAHDPTVSLSLVDPTLITATIERSMFVEPTRGRFQGVGLAPDDAGYVPGRIQHRIITAVDVDRMLERLVTAITTPLGALPPIA